MRKNHLFLFLSVIFAAALLYSCGPRYEFNLDEHLGICGTGWADAAKKAGELLNTRVKNQKDLFSTYNADEAAKLDKAIVKTSGKYAVLCVCDDYDKAESILKDAGF